jgi:hypothetical protein
MLKKCLFNDLFRTSHAMAYMDSAERDTGILVRRFRPYGVTQVGFG